MRRTATLEKSGRTGDEYLVGFIEIEPVRYKACLVGSKFYTRSEDALSALLRWVDQGEMPPLD